MEQIEVQLRMFNPHTPEKADPVVMIMTVGRQHADSAEALAGWLKLLNGVIENLVITK